MHNDLGDGNFEFCQNWTPVLNSSQAILDTLLTWQLDFPLEGVRTKSHVLIPDMY